MDYYRKAFHSSTNLEFPSILVFREPHLLMEKNRSSIESLTGLRFFAASSVAIAHGSTQLLRFDNSAAQALLAGVGTIAGFGMSLFFVLSGFVIHYNYSKLITERGASGCLEFMWARFSRLYPLFLLVLLADLLTTGQFAARISVSLGDALETLRALPWFILFVQSWFYEVIGSNALIYQIGWNSPLTWSISTEWFFYIAYLLLAYPIVAVCRDRSEARVVAFIFIWIAFFWIASTLAFNQIPRMDGWAFQKYGIIATQKHGNQDSLVRWVLYFSPYARIGEFITGCLVSGLYLSVIDKPVTKREAQIGALLTWMALLSVPACLFFMFRPASIFYGIRKVSNNIGLAPSIAVLIYCTARYKNVISNFLSWRPIVAGGEASYSIYLIHMLVFLWIARSSPGATLPATIEGIVFGGARFFCALAILITLSLGLYTVIEVPARTWLRNKWKQGAFIQWRVIGILMIPAFVAGMLLFILNGFGEAGGSDPAIMIRSATYGANCRSIEGNATQHIQAKCGKGEVCEYTVLVKNLGDPAPGCGKDFRVEYSCRNGTVRPAIIVPGEAGLGSRVTLDCSRNGDAHSVIRPDQPPKNEIAKVSASSFLGEHRPEKAINPKASYYWHATKGLPQWWQIRYTQGKQIFILGLRPTFYNGSMVKDFSLEGSNDGVNWESLYSGEHANNALMEYYSIKKSREFVLYRVMVSSVWRNDQYAGIAEIIMK